MFKLFFSPRKAEATKMPLQKTKISFKFFTPLVEKCWYLKFFLSYFISSHHRRRNQWMLVRILSKESVQRKC